MWLNDIRNAAVCSARLILKLSKGVAKYLKTLTFQVGGVAKKCFVTACRGIKNVAITFRDGAWYFFIDADEDVGRVAVRYREAGADGEEWRLADVVLREFRIPLPGQDDNADEDLGGGDVGPANSRHAVPDDQNLAANLQLQE